MIDLKKLLDVLKASNIPVSRLKREGIIGGASYDILMRSIRGEGPSEGITLKSINALCKYLNCQPGDIMEYIPDEEV
ncbi:MAG: helix-turn-helix transcriptional regulator [Clostridia bacterium]|nr:helix-turn-helix transcriptional regulator [Clostridia bacterium]